MLCPICRVALVFIKVRAAGGKIFRYWRHPRNLRRECRRRVPLFE